ncbi:hypothetical protein JAAARDRAFT_193669 [Jaapia argillacea MUCL 33604]|uniref:Uncharacterized protein n=1 Tax=Jaapia argillacea MUCL 33604 TaxID=933084 RepID=A0A067Q6L6_9AGAM|nr:hypothetical protein JAAARDRAFT_193669 [Jaapia argillacea MUCL 33604]
MKRVVEITDQELRWAQGDIEGSNANQIDTQIDELQETDEGAVKSLWDRGGVREEMKNLEKDMDECRFLAEFKPIKGSSRQNRIRNFSHKHGGQDAAERPVDCSTGIRLDIDSTKVAIEKPQARIQKIEQQLVKLQRSSSPLLQRDAVGLTLRDEPQVALCKAQTKLSEEPATLTRFDADRKDLFLATKQENKPFLISILG